MYTFMPVFYNLVQNLVEGTSRFCEGEGGEGGVSISLKKEERSEKISWVEGRGGEDIFFHYFGGGN